ncbi:MAG: 50S ribosomal protein L9 [Ignavibacteriae bacterium]|nr:MAG: 50S ribosomal protein L9 [Ignavibacteriota bacterium]
MKVILKQDYEKLGKIGDAVIVKDGYAMNFLIPNNIVMKATEGNLRVLEELKKQKEKKLNKEIADAEVLASELQKLTLDIKVKAGEEDRIYGSVTSQMISEKLDEMGYKVDKKHIELEEPIKELGIFTVEIKLNNNVKSSIKISVERE